jgi:uncharacterized protein (TIGR01777 family)
MKVAITGSSGLIGKALCQSLKASGHSVFRIVRRASGTDAQTISWEPKAGKIEREKLNGMNAIIHLAGENIASKRWSSEQKENIRQSRVAGTRLLAEAISNIPDKPQVVLSGSAIGFYGNRGDELLTESSNAGFGFLAGVCREWEDAMGSVAKSGIRLVYLRTGVVLTTEAGALQKMLPIFKLGGGGIIGDGRQYMSWISLADEVKAIEYLLSNKDIEGPVNLTAPNPVTNAQFTDTIGRLLHRPTIFPLPGFAAKIVLGEMADALLLSSQRCQPKKLESAGYQFVYPKLEEALAATLNIKLQKSSDRQPVAK